MNYFSKLLLVAFLFVFATSCEETETLVPIEHSASTITTATLWKSGETHIIDGKLTVQGTSLTIEPGTIIKFKAGSQLAIDGQNSALIANGTKDKPILFTSASDSPQKGDWHFISFDGSLNTSSLKYCTIEYAGYSSWGAVDLSGCSISMEYCTVRHSATEGITLSTNSSFVSFRNNTLEDCPQAAVLINANFAHTLGHGNTYMCTPGIFVFGSLTQLNARWHYQAVPFVMAEDIFIRGENHPKLTIAPGNTLKMMNGTAFIVGGTAKYGTLVAEGKVDSLITFTSASLSPQAGDWDYLMFGEGAENCKLAYCKIEYGGNNSSYGMIDASNNAQLSIKNSTLQKAKHFALDISNVDGSFAFTDNTVSDDEGHAVFVHGKMAHCLGAGNTFTTPANTGILVSGMASSYNYIIQDVTWLAQSCAYFFEDDIIVRNGATLTIAAGAILKFESGQMLQVGSSPETGKLIAKGTASKKVIFTASSATPLVGSWDGIRFTTTTLAGSALEYCEVKYAGGNSSYQGNIVVYPCGSGNPAISNCEIANSKYFGIYKKKSNNVLGSPALSANSLLNNTSGEIGQDN
jgi:hypothetical protein